MSVFDSDADRAVYLDLLRERADQYRLLVWVWCLMGKSRSPAGQYSLGLNVPTRPLFLLAVECRPFMLT